MTFAALQDGDIIDYIAIGQKCRFERRQGRRIEWRSTKSFEHFSFTDAEFQKLIRKGQIVLYHRRTAAPPEDAPASRIHGRRRVSSDDLEEATRKLRYVIAAHRVADGQAFTQAVARAAIDEVYEDEGRHWKRLRGRRKGSPVRRPSTKSLLRWVAAAGRRPKQKDLVPNHRYKGNFTDRIAPPVRTIISELVESDYLCRPAISIDDLKVLINVRVRAYNSDNGTAYPLPSFAAIQGSIDAYPKDVVLSARFGEMAAFIRYGSAEAQADPEHPLDRVELDCTTADLFVVCQRTALPLGRPTLILISDRCTRMPLAWLVTFEKPSLHTVFQALRMAMLSKDYVQEMVEENGWDITQPCVTFGIPRILVMDRALENLSEHIAEYAVRAGVNQIHIMAGKRPALKGHIEASIRSVSERVLHPAPGTTFHNTLMKMDYDPQKDAVITLEGLDYALHKYFIDIFPYEPRSSLNNARAIDVWNRLTRKHNVDSVTDVRDLDFAVGMTLHAVPGRHGINCENLQYFSQELLDLQRLPAFANALANAGGKLEFYLDPADMGHIRVQAPHIDETIIVPVASKWREYASGLSVYPHRTIRRFNLEESRKANEKIDLLGSKHKLIEMLRANFLSRKRKVALGQKLARIEGVGRLARNGASAATTVPGSGSHPTAPGLQFDIRAEPSNVTPLAVDTPSVHRASPTPRLVKKGYRP